MKVLVVQDRVLADLGLEEEIKQAGHIVIGSIAHAAEAIHQAQLHKPDVALIDLDRLSAEEACDLAEFLKQKLSISIIAMTAQFDRAKACLDSLLGVIMKPFAFEQVPSALSAIQHVLETGCGDSQSLMVFEPP
jgi:AmiR/NasT family two-component response regulator